LSLCFEDELEMFKRIIAALLAVVTVVSFSVPTLAATPKKEPLKYSISKCEITHNKILVYNGKKQTPKVTVKYKGKKLKEGTHYKLSYKNNKEYGKAIITVTGINQYKDTKTSRFRIAPKGVSIKSLYSDFTMRFTASWSQNKRADGYRMEFSLYKDFREFRFKTVKDNTITSKTILGQLAGRKYYVRIRSFVFTDKGRVYSEYSDVETVRIKNPKKATSKKNKICLTFDDGPSHVTEKVLNVLKKNKVRSTFFIVDYDKEDKPLIRRMIDEGHTLAIHNYSHDYSKIYASTDSYIKYHTKLYKKIKKDFGYEARIMRFPGGTSNTVSRNYSYGIMSRLSKKMTKKGFIYFDWNVDSGDASGNNISKTTIANNVIDGLSKNRTNVVLMHDSGAKMTTAKALQTIINYGNNNGYVFEPITEKTKKVQHRPNN